MEGRAGPCVEMEGHGREELFEELDVSRTVGWFTSHLPGEAGVPGRRGGPGIGDGLKRIKELLRGVPNRGIGYGVLRHMSGDEGVIGRLGRACEAEVRFNYLGQFDQVMKGSGVLRPAVERGGASVSGENRMRGGMEVTGMVAGGRLRMEWVYSQEDESRERSRS